MDELRSKWYSSLPCFRSPNDAYRPQPLGVSAVAGVFILLGFGILAGCLILILEHLVYKYALPGLRRQPKGTIWRSPNMMFFSQVRQPFKSLFSLEICWISLSLTIPSNDLAVCSYHTKKSHRKSSSSFLETYWSRKTKQNKDNSLQIFLIDDIIRRVDTDLLLKVLRSLWKRKRQTA